MDSRDEELPVILLGPPLFSEAPERIGCRGSALGALPIESIIVVQGKSVAYLGVSFASLWQVQSSATVRNGYAKER